jgi:hypothetical protein
MDYFSNSDPFLVVYMFDEDTQKFRCLGHTKVIKNTNNPGK